MRFALRQDDISGSIPPRINIRGILETAMNNSKKGPKRKFWPAKLPANVHLNTDLIPFRNYVYFCLFLAIAAIIAVVILLKWLPPQVPLYYGLPEGEAQLAPALGLILPSLVALAVLTVNVTACFFIEDDFLKKALILTAIGVTFFTTITTIKIIFLVGSF